MKFFKSASVVAVAAVMASSAAMAQDYTLTISSWAPPTHGMNADTWPNIIKMIEEATDGRVTAKIRYGLAPPPAQMDLVLDGAADMTWIFHGYQAGRFVGTQLIELPGYEGNAEAASVAYWRTHEKHLAKLREHRGVKLIGLHTHGPAQVHSDATVTTLADISGMKIRVPGGVGARVGKALGATGIQVPAPKVYETLASKAADGVFMPVEARASFKLTEVAKNMYEVPGGIYRGSFGIVMNEDAFADLPKDLQQALEEKVFGEPISRVAGQMWDRIDVRGREATASAADNATASASEADIAAFNEIAAGISADVMSALDAKGVDAAAAKAMIEAEMAAQ